MQRIPGKKTKGRFSLSLCPTYLRRSLNMNNTDNSSKKIAIMRLNVLLVSKKATRFKTAMITIAAIKSLLVISIPLV